MRGFVAVWVLATAAGETAGLVITTAMSVSISDAVGLPETQGQAVMLYALMAGAGLVEGVTVGAVQWAAARRVLPGLSAPGWISGTAAGFLVAWGAGMALSQMEGAPSDNGLFALAAVHGLILGVAVGALQALALRRRVDKPVLWIAASALAWSTGMLPPVLAARLLPTEASDLTWVLVTAAGGTVSGAVAGLVSGIALSWLLRARPAPKTRES